MSSAHVYVRLNKGQAVDDISEGLLEDCAQLVKANSIQGKFYNDFLFYYISVNWLIINVFFLCVKELTEKKR